MRMLVLNTKYENFTLNGSGDIFDEKVSRNYGRTDGWQDGRAEGRTDVNQYTPTFSKRGYNKQEKASSQSNHATSHCQFSYKTLNFYLK